MDQNSNLQTVLVPEPPSVAANDACHREERHAPISELKRFRVSRRESQAIFWGRFGVTQSSGSRFETGLGIPPPVAILLKLYANGKLSDGDLQDL